MAPFTPAFEPPALPCPPTSRSALSATCETIRTCVSAMRTTAACIGSLGKAARCATTALVAALPGRRGGGGGPGSPHWPPPLEAGGFARRERRTSPRACFLVRRQTRRPTVPHTSEPLHTDLRLPWKQRGLWRLGKSRRHPRLQAGLTLRKPRRDWLGAAGDAARGTEPPPGKG